MAITAAEIVTFVNAVLNRAETTSTIEQDILAVLRDLAGLYTIKATDTSQSLTSSSTYLAYPTASLDSEGAIISVVLTDSASVDYPPLDLLSGGWVEYLGRMQDYTGSSRSVPGYMACHDRKIYLWPPPSSAYTSSIVYFKRHDEDAADIEFSEDWRNAIYYGCAMQVALHRGLDPALNRWMAMYEREKKRQVDAHRE